MGAQWATCIAGWVTFCFVPRNPRKRMMRPWRDDPRFKCPYCGTVIYLTELDPSERPMTRCEVIAICVRCQRVYFLEEWRARQHLRHPHIERDP